MLYQSLADERTDVRVIEDIVERIGEILFGRLARCNAVAVE